MALVFALVFGLAFVGTNSANGNKIVGGTPATKNQFPYQVSIQHLDDESHTYSHFCGGSIISKTCILTAAHCVNSITLDNTVVVAGSVNLNDTAKLRINTISYHPGYNAEKLSNDIAILKLSKPLTFDASKKPINLPRVPNQNTPVGKMATVSGWGNIDEDNDDGSDVLLFVKVPIISDQQCIDAYANANDTTASTILKSNVCAGFEDGKKDACQGDSGGPLVLNNIQIGVVSKGEGCARAEFPGVYAEVSFFLPYLRSTGCIE